MVEKFNIIIQSPVEETSQWTYKSKPRETINPKMLKDPDWVRQQMIGGNTKPNERYIF